MRMKIYNKGQVVIPAELRKKYNLFVGDYIEVLPEDNCIKLIPHRNVNIVDELFGVLRDAKHNHEMDDLLIDRITEDEMIREWRANESD